MTVLSKLVGRLIMVAIGSVVALLIVEIGMRLFYDYLPFPVQSMIRHVRVWDATGPRLGPRWLEVCEGDSYLSARNIPGLNKHRVQYGPAIYHVSTTSLGFEKVGFRTPEFDGGWDGVVVGDSFTFCHHVEEEDCWVTHVAAETGLKLANLGVPATGSASHSRYLEKYGRKLTPRLVIWQYWVNDMREDVEHIAGDRVPCPRATDAVEQSLPPRSLRQWLEVRSIAANLVYQTWERRLAGSLIEQLEETDAHVFETTANRRLFALRGEGTASRSQVATSGFEMTTAAIGLAARRTRARDGQFLLLLAPSNLQVYADELPNDVLRNEMEAENYATDRLITFARNNNIDFLDLRPIFIAAAARGEEIYPFYDVHWTAGGNKLAASAVVSWIQGKELHANADSSGQHPSDAEQ